MAMDDAACMHALHTSENPVARGLADSREKAQALILAGEVLLDGAPDLARLRVAGEDAAAVGADVDVLAVQRQVVLGVARPQHVLVRHRAHRALDHGGEELAFAQLRIGEGHVGAQVLDEQLPSQAVLHLAHARGEVLSVAYAGPGQHQDTGAKMMHEVAHELVPKAVDQALRKKHTKSEWVNGQRLQTVDGASLANDMIDAALVASLVEAECLVILSDVEGLYDRDPKNDPAARLVRRVDRAARQIEIAPPPGLLEV